MNKIAIYPTDTVWGIGASIDSELLNLKVSRIKKQSALKPMSVLFRDTAQISEFFRFEQAFSEKKIKGLFELETTVLFPLDFLQEGKKIEKWVIGESEFCGVRCLNHYPGIRDSLENYFPITTTSLNFHGEPSIISKEAAFDFYKNIENTEVEYLVPKNWEDRMMSGNPSTILKLSEKGMEIVREGAKVEAVRTYLGL